MDKASSSSPLGFALSRDELLPIHFLSHHQSLPARNRRSNISELPPSRSCQRGNSPSVKPKLTSTTTTPSFLLLTILLICISSVHASKLYIPNQMVEGLESGKESDNDGNGDNNNLPGPEPLHAGIERLAKPGPHGIHVDLSPPPNPKEWTLATVAEDLDRRDIDVNRDEQAGGEEESRRKRQVGGDERNNPAPTPARASTASTEELPLPKPFDNGFSENFTKSCQTFMDSMLNNASFAQCLPFSLLLRGSISFFQASRSVTLITRVLDTSCAANSTACSNLLAQYARDLPRSSNCEADLNTQNPLVLQALLGLESYLPLYTASCLRNPSTESYCFADAITNRSSPTDARIYYLPLNMSLPGGSQPTCNTCLQNTMAVFGAATGNRVIGESEEEVLGKGNALRSTYADAADQVNLMCGPRFVNASLAAPAEGLGVRGIGAPNEVMGLLALGVVFLNWLL